MNSVNTSRRMALCTAALFVAGCAAFAAEPAPDPKTAAEPRSVFDGSPAEAYWRIRAGVRSGDRDRPLRILTVEERVGEARKNELVRVPLFLHDGECTDPNSFAIYDAADGKRLRPIPYQADDIRRDASGRVARMHLYFQTDLDPWQRKQFCLIRGTNASAGMSDLAVTSKGDQVTLAGDDLAVTFWTGGDKAGAIAAIATPLGTVSIPDGLLAPRLKLLRQKETPGKPIELVRSTDVAPGPGGNWEVRDLRYGSGPLLAKLVVRVGPKGIDDNVEFTYLLPRNGAELIQSQRLFPGDPQGIETVGAADNDLLTGRLILGQSPADQQIVKIPAGLRRLTRSSHGMSNDALVNRKAGLALFPVPLLQTGVKGIVAGADGNFALLGTDNFHRTTDAKSQTLRAFWGQVRLVFTSTTDDEGLWKLGRRCFQPPTAIVDEPGLTTEMFTDELVALTHNDWGWAGKAAMLYAAGRTDDLARLLETQPRQQDLVVETWVASARKTMAARLARLGRPLLEHEKNSASGVLDPYQISYQYYGIPAIATFAGPHPRLDQLCLTLARAEREFNGRVNPQAFPYIDCFYSAANMQVGTTLVGLAAAKKAQDWDLVQYCRDLARSPGMLDIYGHGQRAYTGNIYGGGGNSDVLYMGNSDIRLRAAEICANDDLWLHPAVYGRYYDCIDVNADLYHRDPESPARGNLTSPRANLFRIQGHDHRWERWQSEPFLGLLAHARDGGQIGLTEAHYFARHVLNQGNPYKAFDSAALVTSVWALNKGLRQYAPEPAPALPDGVRVDKGDSGNTIRWQAAAGESIAGYRVYRANQMGGPWILLNSPYVQPPGTLVEGTSYTDASGKAGQVYFVTAVDAKRRESRWFPEEPLPSCAKDAVPAGQPKAARASPASRPASAAAATTQPEIKTRPEYTVEVDAALWPYSSKDKHFHLWKAKNAPVIRGLFAFVFHGCGRDFAEYPDMRALAAELGCGIVGFDKYYGYPGDEDVPTSVLLDALKDLAATCGHPEVAHAPIFTFGHSNATRFSAGFTVGEPERTIGWIAFRSAGGFGYISLPPAYTIPGMVISGEHDGDYFSGQLFTVRRLRHQHRTLMHMIVEPDAGHGEKKPGSYEMMMAFMKVAFNVRVPADADPRKGPVPLVQLKEPQGWLGQTIDGVRVRPSRDVKGDWEQPTDVKRKLEIAPFADYPGDKGLASWYPTEGYARKVQEFCMTGRLPRWSEPLEPQGMTLQERFEQAQRLEATDASAAAAAYATFADTKFAQQAAQRLKDPDLMTRASAREQLKQMWFAEMQLQKRPALGKFAEDFHQINAEPLAAMRKAAGVLLTKYPNTADASTARLMLKRYGVETP
ncbi:MAG: hypothetical protein FJ288_00470 [Planctomycetes bacterium]|nr:hypothetical protein [Planctomycetota bacterium]